MSVEVRKIGRYIVHRELASGGVGVVLLAKIAAGEGAGRVVAVKRLLEGHARDAQLVATLFDEARLVRHINHPNVVPVLEAFEADGEVVLAMDYVEGAALSTLLAAGAKRGERVGLGTAAAIARGVLQGLHAAHEAADPNGLPLAIVHRDVSPQNILVDVAGTARVADFGIAMAVGRMQSTTEQGFVKGKLRYMSPEQFAGDRIDRRADIWAVGVVLWEMLSGTQLFEETTAAMRFFGGSSEVPPLSSHRAMPAALERVVLRALSRAPADRYATAEEMATALSLAQPSATASDIAAWVVRLAGPTLERRAADVRELVALDLADIPDARTPTGLRRSGPPVGDAQALLPSRPVEPVADSRASSRRRLDPLLLGALVAIAVAGGLAFYRMRHSGPVGSDVSNEPRTSTSASTPSAGLSTAPANATAGSSAPVATTTTAASGEPNRPSPHPSGGRRPSQPKDAKGASPTGAPANDPELNLRN